MSNSPHPSVLAHLTDVHCHPTDAPSGVSSEPMENLQISICAMSSMQFDQEKVKTLASKYPEKVTPAFGYHPWFSHWISTDRTLSEGERNLSRKERHYRSLLLPSNPHPALESEFMDLLPHLPDPIHLDIILKTLRDNLSILSNAMLGEVGLDRSFRVPIDYFTTPRILTSFHIPLEHQVEILEAQMTVGLEMTRNVSLHSVKAQLATLEVFERMRKKHGQERWRSISIDLHSCGFSKQGWIDLEKRHENVFMSLSTVINHKNNNLRELIATCSPDRLLAESDYNDIEMVTSQTWDIVKLIAEVRGWSLEKDWVDNSAIDEKDWGVVRRLEQNWKRFKVGNHAVRGRKGKKNSEADEIQD